MLELHPEGFVEQPVGEGVELAAFTNEAGARRLHATFGKIATEPVVSGWAEEWKRFHVPVVVGQLWIGPPWTKPESGLMSVWIDPGQAFGTGAHATTRLCLEILDSLEPASLLDVGCGSGVLGIAASMLGFAPVVAIDSVEAALEATRRNAAANSVHLDARRVDARTEQLPDAEIVLANIDLPTLSGMTPPPGCRMLVTSGYYENDQPDFPGFDHLSRHAQASWAADLFERG